MTQDETIDMAKKAGKHQWPFDPEFLERFANLVAQHAQAKQREACAKLIEAEIGMNPTWQKHLAQAIRAMGLV
jgi:hypothetical protein